MGPERRLTNRTDLGHLATFVPSKHEPVYNWFYYKEGFSPGIVNLLLDQFGINRGHTVLDPFMGVGTTMLAAKQRGINSFGFDVSPLAVFASRAKLREYDAEKLRASVKKILNEKFAKPDVRIDLPVAKKAFSKYTLEDIIFFKNKIMDIEDEYARDFLVLGLINASTKVSFAEKVGGSIRIEKKGKHIPPLRIILRRILFSMLRDAEHFRTEKADACAEFGDARRLPLGDESIDAVITSPPYLNKIEYTNIYAVEQYLFFGDVSKPAVRSYIGAEVRGDIEDAFGGVYDLPPIAKAYFRDMGMAIKEMFRVLKIGGHAAIIVGNGCFPDRVVESDTLLAELAEKAGFKVNQIVVLNVRWCMRNRTIKVAPMRESMVILEKTA